MQPPVSHAGEAYIYQQVIDESGQMVAPVPRQPPPLWNGAYVTNSAASGYMSQYPQGITYPIVQQGGYVNSASVMGMPQSVQVCLPQSVYLPPPLPEVTSVREGGVDLPVISSGQRSCVEGYLNPSLAFIPSTNVYPHKVYGFEYSDLDDFEVKYPRGYGPERLKAVAETGAEGLSLNPNAQLFVPASERGCNIAENIKAVTEAASVQILAVVDENTHEAEKLVSPSCVEVSVDSSSASGMTEDKSQSLRVEEQTRTAVAIQLESFEGAVLLENKDGAGIKSRLPEFSELLPLTEQQETGWQSEEVNPEEKEEVKPAKAKKKKKKKKKKARQENNNAHQVVTLLESSVLGVRANDERNSAVGASVKQKGKQLSILRRNDGGTSAIGYDSQAEVGNASRKEKCRKIPDNEKKATSSNHEVMPEHFEILADDFRTKNTKNISVQFKTIIQLMDAGNRGAAMRACHLHLLINVYARLDELGHFSPPKDLDTYEYIRLSEDLRQYKKKAEVFLVNGLNSCLKTISRKDCGVLTEVISLMMMKRSGGFDLKNVGEQFIKLIPFLHQAPILLLAKIASNAACYNDVDYKIKMQIVDAFYESFLDKVKNSTSSTLKTCSDVTGAFDLFFKAYCSLDMRCSAAGFSEKSGECQEKLKSINSEKGSYVEVYQAIFDRRIEEKQKYLDDLRLKQEVEVEKGGEVKEQAEIKQKNLVPDKIETKRELFTDCPESSESETKNKSDENKFDRASEFFRKGDLKNAKGLFEEICKQKERSIFYYYARVELIKVEFQGSSYFQLLVKTKELAAKSREYYSDYRTGREDKKYRVKTVPEDLEKHSDEVSTLCEKLAVRLDGPMKHQLYVLDELTAKRIDIEDSGQTLLTDHFLLQMKDVQKGYEGMKWILESAALANICTQEAFKFRRSWLKTLPKTFVVRSRDAREVKHHFVDGLKEHLHKLEAGAEKVESLLSSHGCVERVASALAGSLKEPA